MKKYIYKDQKNLFMESAVINKYPILRQLLEKNIDITDKNISDLSPEEQKFAKNLIPTIHKEAISEWIKNSRYIELENEEVMKCMICNRTNKYIYFISNHENNKEMNVGSECIKKFIGKDDAAAFKRITKRNQRIYIINNEFPGIEQEMEQWLSIPGRLELIIPKILEDKWLNLGYRARKLFNDYLTGKESDESFEQFRLIFIQRDSLRNKIDDYIIDNRNKKHIGTIKIRNWLLLNKEYLILEKLKGFGIITPDIAAYISESEFMKEISKDMRLLFNASNITNFMEFPEARSYVFKVNPLNNLNLKCSHANIINMFKSNIWGGASLDIINAEKSIIKYALPSDSASYEEAVKLLSDILSRSIWSIYDFDIRFGEIILNNSIGLFKMVKLIDFVNENVRYIYYKDPNEIIQNAATCRGQELSKKAADSRIDMWLKPIKSSYSK